MENATKMVRTFHKVYGHPIDGSFEPYSQQADDLLASMESTLGDMEASCKSIRREKGFADLRIDRMQLIVEELKELCQGLRHGDPILIADGVTDLAYVVVGTAVSGGLPLPELFEEVHSSNMTKTPGQFKPVKGANFRAPNIPAIIEGWEL